MMTNLFSMFDPSCSTMSMSWMSLSVGVLIMGFPFFQSKENKPMAYIKTIVKTLGGGIKSTSAGYPPIKGKTLILTSVFLFIACSNFVALFPFVFTTTAHMMLTLPMALITWTSFMLFGWIKNTTHMLAHTLPLGTPGALMMFMVVIELVSNIIRPITLSVRLSANMIAGHLLMCLLGNTLINLSPSGVVGMMVVPLSLTVLESAVSVIQGYVFMTLSMLYFNEIL